MCDSIRRFKTNFLLFFVLINFPVSSCTNTNTICYGPPGPSCTTHKLSCASPLVIQIINTSYGYRPGCNDNGLSQCTNTTCCNEEPGDCFIPFSSEDDQQVVRHCSGLETCTVSGFREVSGTVCGGTNSVYSKIQYDCVTKGSSLTTPTHTTYSRTNTIASTYSGPNTIASTGITTKAPATVERTYEVTQTPEKGPSTTIYTTDLTSSTSSTIQNVQCTHSDNSGIVGGVLGSLLIISVIINVGLVVYFTRKMKALSSTPRENNYDGITNIGRDQTLNTYDALQVPSTASSDHDDKKISDSNHTYYNTKGDSLSRDFNPYYENMKRP